MSEHPPHSSSINYLETDERKALEAQIARDVLDENLDNFLLRDCCQDVCPVCIGIRKLAHVLLDEGCTVCILQNQLNPFGWFEPGMIHVTRDDEHVNANGTMVELSALAHEAGHWRSWKNGLRPPALDAIYDKKHLGEPLTSAEKLLVVEEEELAWKLGRAVLAETAPDLPTAFWDKFSVTRRQLLSSYYDTLV